MQTIETRYIGPTNTKPGRIIARASGGFKVTMSYPHDATNTEYAHAFVANVLRRKCKWSDMYLAGTTQRGFVFAFPPDKNAVWIKGE